MGLRPVAHDAAGGDRRQLLQRFGRGVVHALVGVDDQGAAPAALDRDREKRYPNGQAMADDLEAVLRETGFHARMLPDLLREAFGSDLSNSQEAMSSLTPEMLASITGDPVAPAWCANSWNGSSRSRSANFIAQSFCSSAKMLTQNLAASAIIGWLRA